VSKLTLSVDAMGGDHAPEIVIDGLEIARIRHPDFKFIVFGDEARITPLLAKYDELAPLVTVRHTTEHVYGDDKPSQAVRRGRKTSMWLAVDAVRQGEAQVAVSAGNTGALMAMAKIQLRTLEGIDRPAIASLWPTMRGESVVLDLGANLESDATQLVEFAIMGAAFARILNGTDRPTVGLLNIGTEELKGHDEIKEAAQMLREMPLSMDFRGFVEADGISRGDTDVIVTDGFTGNIALKSAEGTARLIQAYLKDALKRTWLTKIGAFLASAGFKILASKLDPRTHNGGVFVGLNGLVVKSHGGTDGIGFASAIDLAVEMADGDIATKILNDMKRSGLMDRQPQDAEPQDAAQ